MVFENVAVGTGGYGATGPRSLEPKSQPHSAQKITRKACSRDSAGHFPPNHVADSNWAQMPKKCMLASLLSLGLISFSDEDMELMIQAGELLSDVVDFGKQSLRDVFRGSCDDQMFLDMFASVSWCLKMRVRD
jgi:hypothetical protein